jgi:hypothetical protein
MRSVVVPASDISAAIRLEMFDIMERHYDAVCYHEFAADLAEKDNVILLWTGAQLCGFSTQQLLSAQIGNTRVRAVFSGDTIVDQAFWGEQELGRAWCRYVSTIYCEDPATPLFWFLISKGFRTYLYLPLFFENFYPRFDRTTPTFERQVLDTFATLKFNHSYQGNGTVVFPHSRGQLKPGLAVVPERRRQNAHVRFFLERNPGFAEGNELACLAQISPANMKLFAGRIIFASRATEVHP